MKIIRILLGIIVIALSSYCLISKNFEPMQYMLLFLGAFMLVTGISELQKEQHRFEGYMCIIVSLFIFFVSIYSFLLN